MQTRPIITERIRFGHNGRLAGLLAYPAGESPGRAVLICSPHPNFAGDMNNNVITALAERLSGEAVTLRFDYRGIGESRIDLPPGQSLFDYWDAVEQTRDYTDALADTAEAADELSRIAAGLPMIAIGYSFGAVTCTRTAVADPRFCAMAGVSPPLTRIAFEFLANCPKPCLMLSGEEDFVYEPEVAAKLIVAGGPRLRLERLEDADHFFRGREKLLTKRIASFVCEHEQQKEM